MMSIRLSLGPWILAAWVMFGMVLVRAEPSIQWLGLAAASKAFTLTDLASTNFSVEASQDLSAWFQVGSGLSPKGLPSIRRNFTPS